MNDPFLEALATPAHKPESPKCGCSHCERYGHHADWIREPTRAPDYATDLSAAVELCRAMESERLIADAIHNQLDQRATALMHKQAIDEHFELWAEKVERLVGRSIDRKAARVAFECYEAPTKALTPEEYAYELAKKDYGDSVWWGGGWSPPSAREVEAMQAAALNAYPVSHDARSARREPTRASWWRRLFNWS